MPSIEDQRQAIWDLIRSNPIERFVNKKSSNEPHIRPIQKGANDKVGLGPIPLRQPVFYVPGAHFMSMTKHDFKEPKKSDVYTCSTQKQRSEELSKPRTAPSIKRAAITSISPISKSQPNSFRVPN